MKNLYTFIENFIFISILFLCLSCTIQLNSINTPWVVDHVHSDKVWAHTIDSAYFLQAYCNRPLCEGDTVRFFENRYNNIIIRHTPIDTPKTSTIPKERDLLKFKY